MKYRIVLELFGGVTVESVVEAENVFQAYAKMIHDQKILLPNLEVKKIYSKPLYHFEKKEEED